jgi:hypothetical protein
MPKRNNAIQQRMRPQDPYSLLFYQGNYMQTLQLVMTGVVRLWVWFLDHFQLFFFRLKVLKFEKYRIGIELGIQ